MRPAGRGCKATPQMILAQGAHWRFHHELKQQLTG